MVASYNHQSFEINSVFTIKLYNSFPFYITECENSETSSCYSCEKRRWKERMSAAIKCQGYLKIRNSGIIPNLVYISMTYTGA
jgi:hypothetical protein